LAEKEVKHDLASLVAEIAKEECKKLYEKRLAGLEEELAALYKTVEEYVDHPESKFENGQRCGTMRRRHLRVNSILCIGKEANELEETQILGIDEETYVEYREIH
jgi:hypothetical protein